jgi:hypothetical protein
MGGGNRESGIGNPETGERVPPGWRHTAVWGEKRARGRAWNRGWALSLEGTEGGGSAALGGRPARLRGPPITGPPRGGPQAGAGVVRVLPRLRPRGGTRCRAGSAAGRAVRAPLPQ